MFSYGNALNAGQSCGEWAEPADVYPNKWTDMAAPNPEEVRLPGGAEKMVKAGTHAFEEPL